MQESTIVIVLASLFVLTFLVHLYKDGFRAPLMNLLAFSLSMVSTLIVYPPLSILFSFFLLLSKPLADVLAFFILFFTFFVPLHFALTRLSSHLSKKPRRLWHRLDKPPGLKMAVASSIIWLFLVAVSYNILPISPFSNETTSSTVGMKIAKAAIAFNARPKKTLEHRIDSMIDSLDEKEIIVKEPNIPRDTAATFNAQSELRMIGLINNERRKQGLDDLEFDSTLKDIARSHSMDMVRGNFFDHVSPITGSISDRMLANRVFYLLVSENLAFTTDIDAANRDLMASRAHHDSLINSRFNKIGIGVVDCGSYGCMITQILTH